MKRIMFDYISKNKTEILDKWVDLMKEEADDRMVKVVSDQLFFETSNELIDLIITYKQESQNEFKEKLTEFTEKIVCFGWPLSFVITGLKKVNHLVYKGMREKGNFVTIDEMEIWFDFDEWLSTLYSDIINTYTQTWERTVSLQKIALQELSSPVIPVLEGITVMPLIGTIDTERAKQIMENLLVGVVKHRSEVVLIDITGVPLVDTMVAHHIIQAVEAVRLVGATCILCGIRPEIAQTIVALGINLDGINTNNSLKSGFEAALILTNRKIKEVDAK
ncbi:MULTISPECIES: STAS domain-containing protein [Bacillus]|uniref:STAS domain-containing protein n=1 Tax=Bacillus TaxID=1386 RepID=UPI00030477B9|nr:MULTISPECIES: STAS domain-containing protein [Bacillus]